MTRTRLLIASLFMLFCTTTFYGQNMLKEGNQWNVLQTSLFGPDKSTTLFKVYGDTLINDVSYSKLFTSRDTFGVNWALHNEFLREDTTGKVFMNWGGDDEILVLDFGLQVGEIFIANGYSECNLEVTEIDTVLLNSGEERKRLFLRRNEFGFEYTWIEGIGNTFGPTFNDYCLLDVSEFLLCFSEGDEIQFPESPTVCFDEFTTSVQNLLPTDLKIFPNPINQVLNIEFSETLIESYTLVDLLGQEIIKGTLTGGLIDVSKIPTGTFIILLQARDGSVYSEKLIKVD